MQTPRGPPKVQPCPVTFCSLPGRGGESPASDGEVTTPNSLRCWASEFEPARFGDPASLFLQGLIFHGAPEMLGVTVGMGKVKGRDVEAAVQWLLEAPKVHKCLFLRHAVAVVVSAFFNMKPPTFKNGKIPHKMDLTPLEKLLWFSAKDLQWGGADCSDICRLSQTTPFPIPVPTPLLTAALRGSLSLRAPIRVGTWKAKAWRSK